MQEQRYWVMLGGNLLYFLFAFFGYQNIISLMVQHVIISLNLQIFVTWFLKSVLLTSMWWFIHAVLEWGWSLPIGVADGRNLPPRCGSLLKRVLPLSCNEYLERSKQQKRKRSSLKFCLRPFKVSRALIDHIVALGVRFILLSLASKGSSAVGLKEIWRWL